MATRLNCDFCAHWSYDRDAALGHLTAAHLNRRIASVSPNPGRRRTDVASPWVRNNLAAAAAGKGLSRPQTVAPESELERRAAWGDR